MAGVFPRLVRRASLFALVLSLSFAAVAAAQNVGTISGTVNDAQGLAVPGATVSLVNRVSQTSQDTVSDENGKYNLANIPFGIYVLSARALKLIPKGQPFPITGVLEGAIARKWKVGAHVLDGDWTDVGRHDELKKARGLT